MDNDLGVDAGFAVTKPVERKLEAFARRLRQFDNRKGTTNIGATSYEIQIGQTGGYTILAVNGKRNPCLEEA